MWSFGEVVLDSHLVPSIFMEFRVTSKMAGHFAHFGILLVHFYIDL